MAKPQPVTLLVSNQQIAKEFEKALESRDAAKAAQLVQSLGLMDAMIAAFNVQKYDTDVFSQTLWMLRQFVGNNKLGFVIDTAISGAVPSGTYAEISRSDYDIARQFILKARTVDKSMTEHCWGWSRRNVTTRPFYPEFLSYGMRDRIATVAQDHSNGAPRTDRQIALFSLGALFDYTNAGNSTHPQPGTTCILTARAIWHAAGINVISDGTMINVSSGLFAALPKMQFGYVEAKDENFKDAQKGDIFHIQGNPLKVKVNDPKTKTEVTIDADSTHVGIITSVEMEGNSRVWNTVEGGGGTGGDYTKTNRRRLVKMSGGKFDGRWAFHNDTETTAGQRPLQGWYSVSQIRSDRYING